MTASTRRAALGAMLTAPLAGTTVMVMPSQAAQVGHPSDLARACDWACRHMDWINGNDEPWSDERLEAEIRLFDDVLDRVADEPARNHSDLKAKAHILLKDWAACLDGGPLDPHERALLTFLREVITLCA